MDSKMTTWWFAGLLQGAVSIATDDRAPMVARHTMAEVAADLTEHWAYDDNECRRVEKSFDEEKTYLHHEMYVQWGNWNEKTNPKTAR